MIVKVKTKSADWIQTRLEKTLKVWSRKSNVFVCGPFEMMKEMIRAVKKIGFSSARVYKEEFKL